MHAYALDSLELFEFARSYLGTSPGIESVQTHTGAPVLRGVGENALSIFLIGPDREATRQAISWVYKNLHPVAMISLGFSDVCEAGNDRDRYLPVSCLRSAGNTDFGGNPVLFEELAFDAQVQRKLAAKLGAGEAKGCLFGSDRPIGRADEHAWIWSNLGCTSWDQFTSELLLAGRRFLCPVGCAKFFTSDELNRKKVLVDALEALR